MTLELAELIPPHLICPDMPVRDSRVSYHSRAWMTGFESPGHVHQHTLTLTMMRYKHGGLGHICHGDSVCLTCYTPITLSGIPTAHILREALGLGLLSRQMSKDPSFICELPRDTVPLKVEKVAPRSRMNVQMKIVPGAILLPQGHLGYAGKAPIKISSQRDARDIFGHCLVMQINADQLHCPSLLRVDIRIEMHWMLRVLIAMDVLSVIEVEACEYGTRCLVRLPA